MNPAGLIAALLLFSSTAAASDADALRARAMNGDVGAASRLGRYFYDIEKDEVKAAQWIEQAAAAGDAEALYYQALIYDKATDGRRPNTEIVAVLKKSAAQGYAPAQVMLGRIYQYGRRGVPQDLNAARVWYEMAAAKGSGEAMGQLNVVYRQTGEKNANTGRKKENVEWLELGARQGDADAAVSLGIMAETGRGAAQDFQRAARLYQIAADAGNAQGQALLGKLYANGDGVEQDTEKAVFWLTKAAESGYVEAQRKLASVYTGLRPDAAQAYAWLVIALSSLFPQASDLVAVSPDLERLMRSMTPEEIENGQALAVKLAEKIKAAKRKDAAASE